MPLKSVFVTRFFQLVTKRQFAEAERMLERLRFKVHKTEWNRGYLRALRGMFLVQKSNDNRYTLLPTIDLNSKDQLQNHRREFLQHTKNSLHGDYDRGFFSAWADFMLVLLRNYAYEKSRLAPIKEKTCEKKAS